MAFSLRSLFLLSLSLALFTCLASADQNLIKSICSKARNPSLCFEVFKGSDNADPAGLGQIATDAALKSAEATSEVTKKLKLLSCVEHYDDAISNLNDCKTDFKKGDFPSANIKASAAMTDADTCLDEQDPAPPQLVEATQKFSEYCNIILRVSNV